MTQDDLILCSFRYCLGRMTYIVADMCRHLKHNWSEICPQFRKIIIEEIQCAIDRDAAGMEQDTQCWQITRQVLIEKEKELSNSIMTFANKEQR